MKIVTTGSLGNIGKPLTKILVEQGHMVTVISSSQKRQKQIESIGAKAAIGSVQNEDFLTDSFTGADAVYCMVPPDYEGKSDIISYYEKIGENYAEAIRKSVVKRVVDLSSFGAHLSEGTGIIVGVHRVENILNKISDIKLTHIRPTSFYYNLYGFIGSIKVTGKIMANYGEEKVPMVSTEDIAQAIAEELTKTENTKKVHYVCSDERTGPETAGILGEAIGKPDLQWQVITDKEMENALQHAGLDKELSAKLTELYASIRTGKLAEEYNNHKLDLSGKVKLEEFAQKFANAYAQKAQS
ncbi:MAG TPA: NAD-dependent dehydratase [Leeuwenhoekiella sp.]|nr:NAD-dependent dehydratase [Leeuwenhoekiella sp.]